MLPNRTLLECPELMLPCRPDRFSEIRIDTTSAFKRTYLRIDRVEGLDRERNEFGVAFPTGPNASPDAYATVREGPRDGIITMAFEKADRAYPLVHMEDRNDGSSIGGGASIGTDDSLYFTARRAGTLRGDYDLYQGVATKQGIASPQRIGLSTKRFWDAQPALSPDGRSLFFASDRPGGIGGVDLYVSRRDANGRWGRPVNLGPGVNTPCDELTPFISGDGKWFYFSSSGHATAGGYDIFRAPLSRSEVGRAENIGLPVNTVDDEIFPSSPANASPDTRLYYGSNQAGSQKFDVWVLHPISNRRVTASEIRRAQAERITIEGTVRNAAGAPVDSALVRLEPKDPPGDVDSTMTNRSGRYEFQIDEGRRYELTAGSETSLYTREEILIPRSNTENPITHDINLPDTVTFRINFPFNNATDPYEFTLDDRGMPSGERWTDVIENAARFLSRMRTSDGFSVQIAGHTDPIGSDAFNLNLGRRRAEFVRRELIARGVNPAMLAVSTEGEGRKLAMHDGEADELYRARLRRVELVRRAR
ncbi:MAG: PD40 domain-containing protein [bacterium]|nr:PD40 domain-containing protein [Candidatus Kapabacteria bacterium]